MKKLLIFIFVFYVTSSIADNSPINLDFKHIKLAQAINIYSDYTGKNIIIDSSIDDVINLRLHDVKPNDILSILVEMYDLVLNETHGVITIMKRKEYDTRYSSQLTAVIEVHHMAVTDVMQAINVKQKSSNKNGLGSSIATNESTNSIILHGTRPFIDRISNILKIIDVPQKQVIIEAKLVGIGHTDLLNLGFKLNNTVISSNGNVFNQLVDLGVAASSSYSFLIQKAGKFALDLELMMLDKDGKASIISTPTIFTSNNKPASVLQGVSIPYSTRNEQGTFQTDFIEANTSLNITPRISGDDIFLDIYITKDSIGDQTDSIGIAGGAPSIDTRQIKSFVKIKDGETVVLGGIEDKEKGIIYNKIPFLSDIPYIGKWFFTSTESKQKNTNLVVFITPKILNTYNEHSTIHDYPSLNP